MKAEIRSLNIFHMTKPLNPLTNAITNSPLSTSAKDYFLKALEKDGVTPEILDLLSQVVQHAHRDTMINSAIALGNNPTIAQASADLIAKTSAAAEDYARQMAVLTKQQQRLANDIAEDLTTIGHFASV
mgnify:CR=1 FL=1